jgi:hypothetical protein
MRKLIVILSLSLVAAALIAVPVVATGHSTGAEVRTIMGCNTLPTPGLRRSCRRCIARAVPHHFHPEYPGLRRCRPNNNLP